MEYSDLQAVVEELVSFPAGHATVIDQVGSLTIQSPSGNSITVQEILDPVRVETYDSTTDLYSTIVGNLDDSFIGRKYYDDRGGNLPTSGDGDFQESF
jgi:hypothetical protein